MTSHGKLMRRGLTDALSRFLAILCIVALGVGFLCGLLSTEPDMKESSDNYLRKQHTMDFLITGSLGFSEKDILALEDEDYVEEVSAGYLLDAVLRDSNDESYAARITSYDFDDRDSNMNRIQLLEGRWPKEPGECVLALPNIYLYDAEVGEEYTLDDRAAGYDTAKDVLKKEK